VRIRNKLFLALASTGICLVLIMLLLMRWSIDRGMLEYVNTREAERLAPLVQALSALYAEVGDWDTLRAKPRRLRSVIRGFDPRNERLRDHREAQEAENRASEYRDRREGPRPKPLRLLVLDAAQNPVFGRLDPAHVPIKKHFNLRPIVHQGETVGWLANLKRREISEGFELTFIQQQFKAFMLISVLVLVLALVIGWPLARHFIKPIQDIARSVSGLANGRYNKLSPNRSDELGALARDLNDLSSTLERNEQLRKRWLADTSHELRTPISILKGELEAMIDGVRPTNQEGLESLQQEVMRLQNLVGDLYELSNADIGSLQYRKGEHDLVALLTQQVKLHQASFDAADLGLEFKSDSAELLAWVDDTRIIQLVRNVLANSLKYTSAGGKVSVELTQQGSDALISVSDTAPGVPDEALTHLFEHLYRVETSRNRRTGGSGLGLAICKKIVEAHHGTIQARHSDLGGVSIEICLPLDQLQR
jgi:two-component system, OmpR family, sensor histidine kinase BaeS